MKLRALTLCWLAAGLLVFGSLRAEEHVVSHDIEVRLTPAQRTLAVSDQITLPEPASGALVFYLHAGLEPQVSVAQGRVELSELGRDGHVGRYRLELPAGTTSFRLQYGGQLHHALGSSEVEQARGFRDSAGLIDERGSFLSSSSLWYAQFESLPYLSFDLRSDLPADWLAVSQGERVDSRISNGRRIEHWRERRPQQEIYLIAAAFTEYSEALEGSGDARQAQVFLRSPDPQLAAKYLGATAKYVGMYEKLVGPYPYAKFALVENFWETGFGMPSFTLLGTKVIRLPFILNSSYPHEILHNWWGNGVYVDYTGGNWSEGLTAYLADHLIREQQGRAGPYRQQSLQKYRDYAASGRDFALAEFRGRHSPATEAVGYGKTLMLFHMLRRKIGDEKFTDAIRRLYREYAFRSASFADLERVFSDMAGQPLAAFFEQWVERVGAPGLALTGTRVSENGDGYRLEISLEQRQPGEVYQLEVPLSISLRDEPRAQQRVVSMLQRRQDFVFELSRAPLRVDIDPEFDLFRVLAPEETPPAFSGLFGAPDVLVVLPRQASASMQNAWREFARALGRSGPDRTQLVWDDEIDALPDDRAVAVLGQENRFGDAMRSMLAPRGAVFEAERIRVGPGTTPIDRHAFAWATRLEAAEPAHAHARAWITADLAEALPGLARKLPHYHKYSYLAFAGEEPQNDLKGRWPVTDSPLSAIIEPGAEPARLESRAALIDAESEFSAARMLDDVKSLSDPALAGRGFGEAGLEQAAAHIAAAMRDAGLVPGGDDGGFMQYFDASGGDANQPARLANVVGVIPGSNPDYAGQSVVVGAHYDHLGLGWPDVRGAAKGQVHAGADDNASGVAVMLELARALGRGKPARSIVFVAFSAEEAGRLGSRHYANSASRYPAAQAIGMLNLDSVGRLYDDKLLVLGGESASEWPHIFRGVGFVTGVQSLLASEPLDASDQISFHEIGVPAVQLFSGAHEDYHRPGDTADKIDAAGLVKVATVSREVVVYLAEREQALNSQLDARKASPRPKSARRVSLGTVPDFTYQGEGYRLDGVRADSPAARAGLREADIIVAIDGETVTGIRQVSQILKKLQPGQGVDIRFLRDAETLTTRAVLDSR